MLRWANSGKDYLFVGYASSFCIKKYSCVQHYCLVSITRSVAFRTARPIPRAGAPSGPRGSAKKVAKRGLHRNPSQKNLQTLANKKHPSRLRSPIMIWTLARWPMARVDGACRFAAVLHRCEMARVAGVSFATSPKAFDMIGTEGAAGNEVECVDWPWPMGPIQVRI